MSVLPQKPLRIAHVITTLQTGGAEAMLAKLVTACGPTQCQSLVLCLGADGPIGERVRAAGVQTLVLDLRLHWSAFGRLFRAVMTLKRWRPDLLQGWMYHGNLFASLLHVTLLFAPHLMWNIRCTIVRINDFPWMTRAVIRLGAWLSRFPDLVLFNSHAAIEQHSRIGWHPRNLMVLPNGFDTTKFRPDPLIRAQVRDRLGIGPRQLLVGMIARYHSMKDFPNFLSAARELIERRQDARILLAGPQVEHSNIELSRLIAQVGMTSKVTLLGELQDPASVLPALDIFCLSSAWGEGFPNVLGEAMACGVPCVATRVGDCELLIDGTGYVVSPEDTPALVEALGRMAELAPWARSQLGQLARRRIEDHFEIRHILDRYMLAYGVGSMRGMAGSVPDPQSPCNDPAAGREES
jgi:glycosyltransferase involved in cell wall biosynthesis